ncbi:hypothetical protein [Pseudochryseolinea flava]|uniref:Uncharacterized protein n=1 Tax=Pseudochryseolinea flava TaxID=2059302 RepID=A0A364Y0R1_9BACT|nr:hypothetical protein [Pseudochryseolinea flava]RAW00279.1 hypothetical protein DQQ10_14570 [Pseudochryseolinea flava]
MIKSKYIADILDLLLDGDELGQQARAQIAFLTEKNFDYTGVGLFVKFDHAEEIENHRLVTDKTAINGLEIKSTSLEIAAEAIVHLVDGLVDHLEIWSYSGEYPTTELADYKLRQAWLNGQGREIEVN